MACYTVETVCFNGRMITLVADKLETVVSRGFTLVFETIFA